MPTKVPITQFVNLRDWVGFPRRGHNCLIIIIFMIIDDTHSDTWNILRWLVPYKELFMYRAHSQPS